MNKQYDIVIVGGGMVGATLACALGETKLRIAVIDGSAPAKTESADYDLRVSAITPGSKTLFETIGIWDAMRATRVSCIDAMTVWDEGGSGSIHFDSAEMAQPCLGYIVENRVVREAAVDQIQVLHNIDWYCPASVREMDTDAGSALVILEDGTELASKLIVGADGATSIVRQWAGIDVRSWSFMQKAIVATVSSSNPHQGVARQRFLATGPLAFLPLDDPATCSIVWSADTDRADELLALNDSAFLAALNTAIGDGPGMDLGTLETVSKRAAFPLYAAHARDYVGERVVLVGDAAHRIHPLAGQGLNLGLADVAALAEVLAEAWREKRDIGCHKTLRRYQRWRRGDNSLMLATMDGFKRLFGSDNPVLSGVRNLGLDMTDMAAPLKYRVMRYAAGLAGDRPRLMRGKHL
jgi:2-octaprenylphenol hydroxylase